MLGINLFLDVLLIVVNGIVAFFEVTWGFIKQHPIPFIIFVCGLGIIVILRVLWALYCRWQDQHSFRFQARKIMSEIKKRKGLDRFFFLIGRHPTPEMGQSIVVGLIAISLFVVARWVNFASFFDGNVWIQIYLLILTATLPGAIFLLRIAVRKSEEEIEHSVRAIYYLTGVRVTVIAELVVLFLLIVGHTGVLPQKSVSAEWVGSSSGALSIWAVSISGYLFYQIFNVAIRPKVVRQATLNILKKGPRIALEQELVRRATNSLLIKFCKDSPMVATPYDYYQPDKEQSVEVFASKSGTILDVDPQKLRSLAEIARKKSPLRSTKSVASHGEEYISLVEPRGDTLTPPTPLLGLRGLIGYSSRKRHILMLVDKDILDDRTKRCIHRVFKLGKEPSQEMDFQPNLNARRERYISLLKMDQTGEATEIADEFQDIFDNILDESKDYAASYADLLDLPWQSVVGNFENVLWEAVRDSVGLSKTKALEVTFKMLSGLCSICIREKDPGWLRVIMKQYRFIYQMIYRDKKATPEFKKVVVNKIWRAIKNIAELYIRLLVKRETQVEEWLVRISGIPLIELNWLAKDAIDASAKEDFAVFLQTIHSIKLYEDSIRISRRDSVMEEIQRILRKSRNTSLIGLGGWIIERFRDKTLNKEIAKELLEILQNRLSISLEDLLDAVYHPLDLPSMSRFGWGDWDWKREDREETPMNVYQMRSGEPRWVYDYFFIEAIRHGDRIKNMELIQYDPSQVSGFSNVREEHEKRLKTLEESGILKDLTGKGKREINKSIGEIKGYLKRVELNTERKRKEWLRDQEIHEEKYKVIKDSVSKVFPEHAILRRIIENRNKSEIGRIAPRRKSYVSLYRLWDLRSSYFKEEDKSDLAKFWEENGRTCALHDSIYVIHDLLRDIPPKDVEGTPEEIITRIESEIKEMQLVSLSPDAIILLGGVFDTRTWHLFEQHKDYKRTSSDESLFPNQQGVYQGIPIVDIWWGHQDPLLLIIHGGSVWLRNAKLGEGYKGILEFNFEDLAEKDRAEEVLKNDHSWMVNRKDQTSRSKEDAILEIQQHVFVSIYEQCEIMCEDSRAVRFFNIQVAD